MAPVGAPKTRRLPSQSRTCERVEPATVRATAPQIAGLQRQAGYLVAAGASSSASFLRTSACTRSCEGVRLCAASPKNGVMI